MRKQIKITVKDSCDSDFINRTAKDDPFEYWNRCIAPETARNEFEYIREKNLKINPIQLRHGNNYTTIKVTILETNQMPYNYHIIYEFEFDDICGNNNRSDIVDAIVMRFGFFNCKIEEF